MFMDGTPHTAAPTAAGLGRRIGARLIDGVAGIVLALVVGFLVVIGTFTFGSDLGIDDGTLATLGDLVLLFALLVVFLGPFVAAAFVGVVSGLFGKGTGTTPGRCMVKLRVVDADDGQPSRGRAALHALLGHLPMLLIAVGLLPVVFDGGALAALAMLGAVFLVVDVLAPFVRKDDRALHDVLAGVTVVRRS